MAKSEFIDLGDFVWLDLDEDGIQDDGEPGVENVRVQLLDARTGAARGEPVYTDANGHYQLDNIRWNSALLQFTPPGKYEFRENTQDKGKDDSVDSDVNVLGRSDKIMIAEGAESDDSYDAAVYLKPTTVGDRVWLDENGNGQQDEGEPGLEGVTVRLMQGREQIAEAVSDIEGNYYLEAPDAGDYHVKFELPESGRYIFSRFTLHNAAGVDDTKDSDAHRDTGETHVFHVNEFDQITDIDAGLFDKTELLSLGDKVWFDANENGVQDVDESGVEGIEVRLYDGENTRRTETDAQGEYAFGELLPGDYRVQFILPRSGGYSFTEPGIGDDVEKDSNADSRGNTATITLVSGHNDMSVDAGLAPSLTVGDFIWHDQNANGLQDEGEPGIENVVVRLYHADGQFTGHQMMTDENGKYTLEDVASGDYKLWVVPKAGYQSTDQAQGDDAALDSDINAAGYSEVFTVAASTPRTDIDGGLVQNAAIGDLVWYDRNVNGHRWSGEGGVRDQQVELYDATGSELLAETTTSYYGSYKFDGLKPGDYKVKFYAPDGYEFTHKDMEYAGYGGDANDSDANPLTGFSDVISVADGEYNDTVDAGIWAAYPNGKAAVGDTVWHDLNGNGVFEQGEPGVGGVRVDLYDGEGNFLDKTTYTNSAGSYSFQRLEPGDYQLRFSDRWDHIQLTHAVNAGPDGVDSDADPDTGFTEVFTLHAGEYNYSMDAGVYIPGTLGDLTWSDNDYNGYWSSGDAVLPDVKVYLYEEGKDAPVAETVSNNKGRYYFIQELLPGKNYQVQFETPDGYKISPMSTHPHEAYDSDIDPDSGLSEVISLTSNQKYYHLDAGFYQHDPDTAVLGDKVWHDVNGNGLQDEGEVGIAGATVDLFDVDSGARVTRTVTNDEGLYKFVEVKPGDYKVRFYNPSSTYTFTQADALGNSEDAKDSDNIAQNTTYGETEVITLEAGETDLTIDAGFYKAGATIGNQVWLDRDANGFLSAEGGVRGVDVHLYDASGGTVLESTTTGNNGGYYFYNVAPGDYRIKVDLPSDNYGFTIKDGWRDDLDSDVDQATGFTDVFTVEAGKPDYTIDAGLIENNSDGSAEIGDRVFHDINGNGQWDYYQGESWIPQVDVILLDDSGAVVATTQTDRYGQYFFKALDAGDYQVKFDLKSGFSFSPQDRGSDGKDSDVDPDTGITDSITIGEGERNYSIDAGMYEGVDIGDRVWLDENGNGVQDRAEKTGVADVTVRLLDLDGNEVATTSSDENGEYRFSNQRPGEYQIEFVKPDASYVFVEANIGNDRVDSDADQTSGLTQPFTVKSGQAALTTIDAGMTQKGSIGDMVWEDLPDEDGKVDGIYDVATESGMAGVKVELYKLVAGRWVAEAETMTDAQGQYLFNELTAGDYSLKFAKPSGYVFTWQDKGDDEALDSDVSAAGDVRYQLVSGEQVEHIDAGLTQSAKIGDYLWVDHDIRHMPDGIQGHMTMAYVVCRYICRMKTARPWRV